MKYPISVQAQKIVFSSIAKCSLFRALFDKYCRTNLIILCYHSISDNDWEFSVKPKDFEKQMQILLKKKKSLIGISDAMKLKQKFDNALVITFDDGYEDVYTNAYPILKKYKIPACVFVTGGNDKVDRCSLGTNKNMLSISQIKKLKKERWEIGYHSDSHKDLTKLSAIELQKEIVDGKKNLERELGFQLNYFAYPFGNYSKKIIKILKIAGINFAFTFDGCCVDKIDNIFKINRIIISKFINPKEFGLLITTPGVYINYFITYLIRIKYIFTGNLT